MEKAGQREGHQKMAEEKDKYHDFMRCLSREERTEFLKCSRWALRHLINEKNKKIKQKTIISISKALKTGKHPITGKFSKKKLTQTDITAVLNKNRDEIRIDTITKEILRTGRIGVDIERPDVPPLCSTGYKVVHYTPTGNNSAVKVKTNIFSTELMASDDVNKIFGEVKKRFDEIKLKFPKSRCDRLYFLLCHPEKFKEYFQNHDILIFYCGSRSLEDINARAKELGIPATYLVCLPEMCQ